MPIIVITILLTMMGITDYLVAHAADGTFRRRVFPCSHE